MLQKQRAEPTEGKRMRRKRVVHKVQKVARKAQRTWHMKLTAASR